MEEASRATTLANTTRPSSGSIGQAGDVGLLAIKDGRVSLLVGPPSCEPDDQRGNPPFPET